MIYQYILDLVDSGLIRKGKALDLGCGPGNASMILAGLEFEVDAVDKKDQVGIEWDGRISFINKDIRDFEIMKNTYEFINARNVLHFLDKHDIKMMIERMYDGLKKGGVMYFNVSGDKDGWKNKSKSIVTFLTDRELVKYIECVLVMPVYNKVTRLGYGTTTSGILKYTHTISYTVVKK